MRPTPSQTIGPFFGFALPRPGMAAVVPHGTAAGMTLAGTVYDAAGEPIRDALIELWQADPQGRLPVAPPAGSAPRFRGFGRCATDREGRYCFHTVQPGAILDGAGALQTPHMCLVVFARGLLNKLLTRVYLPGEARNAADPLLSALPEDQRITLIAQPEGVNLRHDVHLSGAHETVFLAF